MNILVVTKHLDDYAGSELFTRDIVFELIRRGHRVSCFSWELGKVSDEMKSKGVEVVDNLSKLSEKKFDVVHAQHSISALLARAFFPSVPMVFLVHGNLSEFEQLPVINLRIAAFCGVSEETVRRLTKQYSISESEVPVVRNPIDTWKFQSVVPINEVPKKLLVLSNHYAPNVKQVIEGACRELGIEVTHVGLPENPQKDVEKYINQADIVVTLGRGVLEAMVCERNVIIFDWNGGDGFVNEQNFYMFRQENLSGRYLRKKFSIQEFKAEISKYSPHLGAVLREIIVKEYGIEMIVTKLESIYQEAIGWQKSVGRPSIGERLLLSQPAVLWYVHFIVWENRVKKTLRLLGLRKDLGGRRSMNLNGFFYS